VRGAKSSVSGALTGEDATTADSCRIPQTACRVSDGVVDIRTTTR